MSKSDDRTRELSGRFFEGELKQYGDVVPPSGQEDRHLNALLTHLTEGRERFSLLDVGCGVGYVARAASALFPEASVCGVDLSSAVIEKAKELDPRRLVRFDVANEIHMPYADGSFEFAVCRFSIHHYPRIREHLGEVHRLLKPAGTYLVIDVVPDRGKHDEWLNDLFVRVERETTGHVRFYTLDAYDNLLQQSGYSVVRVVCFPLLLDFTQDHMLYEPAKKMPPEFRGMVSFREYDDRFSFALKAAGVYARKVGQSS